MTVYNTTIELFDHFRKIAQEYGCNPCFDGVQEEIHAMNEKGEGETFYCLCKLNTTCPCSKLEAELEKNGVCHCGIFRRVK
ncbi:MAG: hypothetical protein HF308_20175 [Ignavibacteria bacterium]|jgi:ferredoxin-thioredoxin reductase catalytic subunit|nr:hypothetical protein [Ignavibacteria bacterium]